MCCDRCPRVFHEECLDDPPSKEDFQVEWLCPYCTSEEKASEVAQTGGHETNSGGISVHNNGRPQQSRTDMTGEAQIKTFDAIAREHAPRSPINSVDTAAIDAASEILDHHAASSGEFSTAANGKNNALKHSLNKESAINLDVPVLEESEPDSSVHGLPLRIQHVEGGRLEGLEASAGSLKTDSVKEQDLLPLSTEERNKLSGEIYTLYKNQAAIKWLEEHIGQRDATIDKRSSRLDKHRESLDHPQRRKMGLVLELARIDNEMTSTQNSVEDLQSQQDSDRELNNAAKQQMSRLEKKVKEIMVRLGVLDA